jgi:uncharacterized protein (UPF0261 family)
VPVKIALRSERRKQRMTHVAVYGSARTLPCKTELANVLHADGFAVVLPALNTVPDTLDALIALNGTASSAPLGRVPSVVVPGEMEAFWFASAEAIPVHLRRRQTAPASEGGVYVRADLTEYARQGRELAFALNALDGKLAVCLPLRGLSSLDDWDAPFFSTEMRMALFGNLTTHLRHDIPLFEGSVPINSSEFALLCAETLLTLL